MREFIKIHDPDGLVFFDKLKYADISIMRGEFGLSFLSIEVISLDGPYAEAELQGLRAKQIGRNFHPKVEYVHVQLRHALCNYRCLDDFLHRPLRISQGYGMGIYTDTDPIVYAYMGWSMELLHNELKLTKEGNDYYLHWTAHNEGFASDIGEKPDQMELCARLNPYFLKEDLILPSADDFWLHSVKKKEINDFYFAIFRALETGSSAPEGIDIALLPKGNSSIENSLIAWDYAMKQVE